MDLQIVRVERAARLEPYRPPEPESAPLKAWNFFKRRPALALAVAPVAVSGAMATGIAAGVAGIGIAAQEYVLRSRHDREVNYDEREIERLYASDIAGKTDVRGKTLQYGNFYVRHPIDARCETLIPARSFHRIILEEQLAEIVEYIRSQLSATRITIVATSEKTGAFVAGGSIHSVSVGSRLGFGRREGLAYEFTTRSPVRVELKRPLPWLRDFPVLVASLAEARDGEFQRTETTDLEFGLSLDAVTLLGVDVRWVSRFTLDIRVDFA